jgi:hypothetical protein
MPVRHRNVPVGTLRDPGRPQEAIGAIEAFEFSVVWL